MKPRQEFRQHSKSTLLKAAQVLMAEKETLLLVEGRKWRRRLAWAAGGAFLAGLGIGAAVVRLLPT